MSRYIDADVLIAEFHRLKLGEHSLIERLFADGVYSVIETFPTADVQEVKHAKWYCSETGYLTCIRCGNSLYVGGDVFAETFKCAITLKYCPNCGAKMDGE